jgi:hypothetical protein
VASEVCGVGHTSVRTQPSCWALSWSFRAASSAACSFARCASERCLYCAASSGRGPSPRAGAPASTGSNVSDPLPSRLCSFAARWIRDEKNLQRHARMRHCRSKDYSLHICRERDGGVLAGMITCVSVRQKLQPASLHTRPAAPHPCCLPACYPQRQQQDPASQAPW